MNLSPLPDPKKLPGESGPTSLYGSVPRVDKDESVKEIGERIKFHRQKALRQVSGIPAAALAAAGVDINPAAGPPSEGPLAGFGGPHIPMPGFSSPQASLPSQAATALAEALRRHQEPSSVRRVVRQVSGKSPILKAAYESLTPWGRQDRQDSKVLQAFQDKMFEAMDASDSDLDFFNKNDKALVRQLLNKGFIKQQPNMTSSPP